MKFKLGDLRKDLQKVRKSMEATYGTRKKTTKRKKTKRGF